MSDLNKRALRIDQGFAAPSEEQVALGWVYLPLTQGKVAKIEIEDLNRPEIGLVRWYAHLHGSKNHRRYSAASSVRVGGRHRLVYLHRVVMNYGGSKQVDHENGDSLDCLKSNLRICLQKMNNRNRRSLKGRSRFKGVSWSKQKGCWHVSIWKNGRHIHVAYEKDEITAALLYDAAAIKHHGAYASLNFTEDRSPGDAVHELELRDFVKEGREAANGGRDRCENPYSPLRQRSAYVEWDSGWMEVSGTEAYEEAFG